jgi:hypothetical protein
MAAFHRSDAEASKHYKVAILLAGHRGLIHDQALACECLGEYYLSKKNTVDIEYHLIKAVELYEEWGAMAKVEQMKSKHKKLLSPPSGILVFCGQGHY